MQKTNSKISEKLAASLLNIGFVAGLAMLSTSLISCSSDITISIGSNTTPTITSITPPGIVASSVPQTLSILGSNFASGMTLDIRNSSGVPYTITASSVTSSTVITADVVINTAPADNYVTLTLQPQTGTPASAVVGVAGSNKTVLNSIQAIFTSKCATCHSPSNASGLDLSDARIGGGTGVIGIQSVGCYPKFRVVPGDPRRGSSILIDRIKAEPATLACDVGHPMPPAGSLPALTAQDITDIVDWVAGGAN